jgi:iron-sulfur cluster assembly protein
MSTAADAVKSKTKRALPPPVRITDAAARRINDIVAKAPKPVLAEEKRKFEDVVEHNGAKVFIDPKALMYLLGSELDYRESKMESGFVFTNPNEKGRCGCGESFSV